MVQFVAISRLLGTSVPLLRLLPLLPLPHLSITFGTRKYGGSGSGACAKTSSATAHGTTKSSRSVASACWSVVKTCAIGSTLVLARSIHFPHHFNNSLN